MQVNEHVPVRMILNGSKQLLSCVTTSGADAFEAEM